VKAKAGGGGDGRWPLPSPAAGACCGGRLRVAVKYA